MLDFTYISVILWCSDTGSKRIDIAIVGAAEYMYTKLAECTNASCV